MIIALALSVMFIVEAIATGLAAWQLGDGIRNHNPPETGDFARSIARSMHLAMIRSPSGIATFKAVLTRIPERPSSESAFFAINAGRSLHDLTCSAVIAFSLACRCLQAQLVLAAIHKLPNSTCRASPIPLDTTD